MTARILIADDEKIVRDLFERILEEVGYEIVLAEDGEQALKSAEAQPVNLAILDIKMPGLDGIEVLKRLKSINPSIEVIILTGYATIETAVAAMELGAYDFLKKPLDNIQAVLQKIKNALDKQKITIEKKELAERLEKRIFELSVLYDVSNAIGYTMDYEKLAGIIMSSLSRVIDYDVSVSLLLSPVKEDGKAHLLIHKIKPVSDQYLLQVKQTIFNSINLLLPQPIDSGSVEILEESAETAEAPVSGSMVSFFNIPLMIEEEIAGMINISSSREKSFTADDIRLLYTISNQMSSAIRRLRKVISAEKSKMDRMVNSMQEGIILIDERGKLAVVNPAAENMLAVRGKKDLNSGYIFSRLGGSETAEWFEKIMDGRETLISGELDLLQGKIIHLQAESIKDEKDKVIGMVIVLRDVTKEKELERMKTEFVTTVSHELRTPLAAIQGIIANLLDGIVGGFTKEQHEYLDMASQDADRLAKLINNLLDLSKYEAGKMELHKEESDIRVLIDKCVLPLQPKLEEKKIILHKKAPPELPVINIDPNMIMQVITNLVSNAVKFCNEGGEISITVNNDEEAIKVCVSDNGVGISPENLPKLFTKFYQIERKAGPGSKGTGLGLSICKQIIEMHNGKIWAESKSGEGSVFSFTLPLK